MERRPMASKDHQKSRQSIQTGLAPYQAANSTKRTLRMRAKIGHETRPILLPCQTQISARRTAQRTSLSGLVSPFSWSPISTKSSGVPIYGQLHRHPRKHTVKLGGEWLHSNNTQISEVSSRACTFSIMLWALCTTSRTAHCARVRQREVCRAACHLRERRFDLRFRTTLPIPSARTGHAG